GWRAAFFSKRASRTASSTFWRAGGSFLPLVFFMMSAPICLASSSSPVAIEPARLAAPEITNRVASARRDEKLLAERGAVRIAVDLELDVALDDHDELVDLVHVVRPDLPGRID